MTSLITTIHIITCFVLVVAVLLQSGKSADLAGAFGGAGSQTVFGPRGAATILSKVTTVCAILFMLTSMGLWILSAKGTRSVIKGEEEGKETAPVTETVKEPTETKAQEPVEKQQQQEKKGKEEGKEEPKGEYPSP
ncbi:MAG: preprotein translocase subunit SecG [Candidatus Aminicenantes bacterium]|nr:preprotein translocase subunit SecG [Candidatus Aminicenantes bacterium]